MCWSNCCIHGNWRANARQLLSSVLKCYWSLSVQNFTGQFPVRRLGYWRFSPRLCKRHSESSKVIFCFISHCRLLFNKSKIWAVSLKHNAVTFGIAGWSKQQRGVTGVTREISGSLGGKRIWVTLGKLFIIDSDTEGNFTIGIAESRIPQFKWMYLKILSKNSSTCWHGARVHF